MTKKIIRPVAVLLIVCLVFSLTACKKEETPIGKTMRK